jgi:coenzyme F420-reducing hydrogenase delta subunit
MVPWEVNMAEYNPNVVCFSCKFGWGYVSDEHSVGSGVAYWVPVVCSGKIESTHILNAFKHGADGVLILACEEGHCHFQDGNFQTGKRVYLLQRVLEAFGIERERVRMDLARDPDGMRISRLVDEMKGHIAGLGPVKRFW